MKISRTYNLDEKNPKDSNVYRKQINQKHTTPKESHMTNQLFSINIQSLRDSKEVLELMVMESKRSLKNGHKKNASGAKAFMSFYLRKSELIQG